MDKELRKGNMIPGSCDEFTQPEEIEALSKFLGNVRKAYDENTKLEDSKLGVYGRSDIKETEALSRNLDRLGISQKERFTRLSEEVDKIKDNKEIPLSNRVENLKDQRNSKLEKNIEKLILGGDTISSLSAKVESLGRETEDKLKLSEVKDTIQSSSISELSNQVEGITDEGKVNKLSSTKQELQDNSPTLETLDNKVRETLNPSSKINLTTEKEKLKTGDTIENLEKKTINLEDNSNIKSLSDQVSRISNRGEEPELVKRKKKDTTKEDNSPKQELSDNVEKLRNINNVDSLSRDKENLVVSSKINLTTEKEKLKTGDTIENLEKKTINLEDNSNIKSLSDQVSKISNDKEVTLTNAVESLIGGNLKNPGLSEENIKLSVGDEIEKLPEQGELLPNKSTNDSAQLSEKVDKITNDNEVSALSSYYDELQNNIKINELSSSIDKLSIEDSEKSLSTSKELVGGEQKKVVSLSSSITKINTNEDELSLSAHKENLENDEKVEILNEESRKTIPGLGDGVDSLSEEIDTLTKSESAQVSSLANQVSEILSVPDDKETTLSSDKQGLSGELRNDPELGNEVIEKLEVSDDITSLVSENEKIIGQVSDDNELSGKVVTLSDSGVKGDRDLSNVVERITDDTNTNLSEIKELITPKEDQELSGKKEVLIKGEDIESLSDTKINISDDNEPGLSSFIDELEQEDDLDLSEVVERITDDTTTNLSEIKESITPKEDQELSEKKEKAPKGNHWSGKLSGKKLNITKNDVSGLSSKTIDAPKDDTEKEGHEEGKFGDDDELGSDLLDDNILTKKDTTSLSSTKKSTPTNTNTNTSKDSLYDTYIDINGDTVKSNSEDTELDEDFEVDEGSLSSEKISAPKDDIKKEGHEEGKFDGKSLYDSILGPTEEKTDVEGLNTEKKKRPENKNTLDPDERRDKYTTSELANDVSDKSYKSSILVNDPKDFNYAKKTRKSLTPHYKYKPDGGELESIKDVSTFQSNVIDAVESRIDEDSYYQKILKLASITDKPDTGINGTPGLMAKIASLASAYLSGGEITKERYAEFEGKLFEAVMITKEISGYQNTPTNQGGEVTELKGKNRSALGSLIYNTSGVANVPSTKLPAFNLGAINLNNYLRFTAEKSIGNIKFLQGTARKVLLDETLDALIYARDVLEKLTKANRDRLPGNDNGLLSSAVSGGLKGFATAAVGAIFGGGSLNTEKPLNRPKTCGINSGRKGNNWMVRTEFTGLSNKFESAYDTSTGGKGEKISVKSRMCGTGLKTTIEELCGKELASIESVESLMSVLEESPYVTTASKFTSTHNKPYKVMSLDSNNYWEIIFEPFVGEENGNKSYLPSIREINQWNKDYHNIQTDYTRWLPILSFDLSKSKMTTKTLGLFDGEISYPVSMEFTNELKLTFADDQYKSLRTYFERCVDASIYSSEVHDKKYYEEDSKTAITKIDKTYTHVAFYKNITFRCTIYSMTPQKSTVSKYDLLVVIKDFTEERSGEIEDGGTDLTVSFSIVGENPSNARTTLKDDVVGAESKKLGNRGGNKLGAGSKIASVAKKAVSGVLKAL